MTMASVGVAQTTSMTTRPPANNNIQNLSQIVKSVRADIAHLKAQMESLPPFPEGKSHTCSAKQLSRT